MTVGARRYTPSAIFAQLPPGNPGILGRRMLGVHRGLWVRPASSGARQVGQYASFSHRSS
ncbi:MAG: hypothetical protein KGL59_09195 [Acidobacteriota bacterium]|nr:hypothetical protein [Acidobacteriota bacterium]